MGERTRETREKTQHVISMLENEREEDRKREEEKGRERMREIERERESRVNNMVQQQRIGVQVESTTTSKF